MPVEPTAAPLAQVGMNLLGPFPASSSGKRWIIVAADYLTRYAETAYLVRRNAVQLREFFVSSTLLRHGAPAMLITDRGTAFTVDVLKDAMKLTDIDHKNTKLYNPQASGLTEWLNRAFSDVLSVYVDIEHRTWPKILLYATFAYNTAVKETTRKTPFELVFGREVVTHFDAMLPVDR